MSMTPQPTDLPQEAAPSAGTEASPAEGSGPLMLRGGSVYSAADPFATAVIVESGRVAWVGQEAGADSLTDQRTRTVELDGLLLTPGFTALLEAEPSQEQLRSLRAAGYTRWLGSLPQATSGENDAAGGPVILRGAAAIPEGARELLVIADAEDGWLNTVREAMGAGLAVGLLAPVDPDRPASPWTLAARAVTAGERGLSVRGTFTLQTRGISRILEPSRPLGGQVVPGAEAEMIGWETEALMVQTADSRIAAWSTDPRARTPLLPALDGQSWPQARLSVTGDRVSHLTGHNTGADAGS